MPHKNTNYNHVKPCYLARSIPEGHEAPPPMSGTCGSSKEWGATWLRACASSSLYHGRASSHTHDDVLRHRPSRVRRRPQVQYGLCRCSGQGIHPVQLPRAVFIAWSTGDAKCYGLVNAVSGPFGEQTRAAYWGVEWGICILRGATAGLAIGSRRGLGRAKQLSMVFLWVQDHVTSVRVCLGNVHTSENPRERARPALLRKRA